jgi:CPA2 family monovalent cation:H+ antiporter-2
VYLAVVSAVLIGSESLADIATDVAVAVGFLFVLVLAVYRGSELFERYLAVGSEELFVIRAVAATVLVGGAALALGVSEAVAAFFVGMGFSSTSHVYDFETRPTPLRDVFAAVFFLWIGLNTDPAAFVDFAVGSLLVVLVVVTTPTKLVSGFLAGRVYGLPDRRSLRAALGLVTRGEFSLIIAALAAGSGGSTVLTETIPAVAVGYVLVVSILGTVLMQYSTVFEGFVSRNSGAAVE